MKCSTRSSVAGKSITADASCHEWGICNAFCIGGIIQAERSLHRREIYDGFHFLALSYILDKKKEKDEERQTAKAL